MYYIINCLPLLVVIQVLLHVTVSLIIALRLMGNSFLCKTTVKELIHFVKQEVSVLVVLRDITEQVFIDH